MKIPNLHLILEEKFSNTCDYIVVKDKFATAISGQILVKINLDSFYPLSQLPDCLIEKSDWETIAGLDPKTLIINELSSLILVKRTNKKIPFKPIDSNVDYIDNIPIPKVIYQKLGGVQFMHLSIERLKNVMRVFDGKLHVRMQVCENTDGFQYSYGKVVFPLDVIRLDFIDYSTKRGEAIYVGFALIGYDVFEWGAIDVISAVRPEDCQVVSESVL